MTEGLKRHEVLTKKGKAVLFANTDWYLFNFRLPLAMALRREGYDVILLSPVGQYGPRLRELGFRWEIAPMDRRSLNPFREFSLLLWLVKFLRAERPSVLHNFTVKCAIYGALAARWSRVKGKINAVAGMGYVFSSRDLKARVLRPLVSALMRFAFNSRRSVLILQNPDDAAIFRAAGISESIIRVIKGSGVDCEKFSPGNEKLSIDNEPLKVLLAARLLWDKGIAEYVEAARAIMRDAPKVKFLLAGPVDDGNPAAVSRELVDSWVSDGLIEWLGHVEDMPKLLRQIDVMVLPSYREGLPKTLIEAAACGRPLITTDVPGCREVVDLDGINGLVVPPRDAQALTIAIKRLIENRDFRLGLGVAAREKVVKEFSDEIVLSKTIAVYRQFV